MGKENCICVSATAFIILALTGMIIGIAALAKSKTVVPPGEVGIVITRGNLRAVGPGRHKIKPFASEIIFMSGKTQLLSQHHSIPTKEGLTVQLDTSIQYRLDKEFADVVYRDVGEDYANKLIAPASSSIIRSLTSEQEAKALYTSGRFEIQSAMEEQLIATLEPRGIIVEAVLLQGVVLPAQLRESIELKAQSEQEVGRMEFRMQQERLQAEQDNERAGFRVEQERLESERKAVEAQGIAEFQRIVSEGISENLLKWKAIEATVELATSDNAKLVVMGNGQHDLPVLLNGGGDASDAGE
jgi:prohibitin 1